MILLTLFAACSLGTLARDASARHGNKSARSLSAPRNFAVSTRTRTTIRLRWMRARGGRKPHSYLVYVDRRKRAVTKARSITVRRLRCGKRYRIWLATRDRGGRVSKRKKRWVRTNRCAATRIVMPRPIGAVPTDAPGGAATGGAASSNGGAAPAPTPPVVAPPPGGGIPPGGGSGGAGVSLPARLPESRGATYHVANDGSDSAAGSQSAPWRTIQKALDTLRAGETALVHAGTYAQSLTLSRAGTASAPITIRNAPGESAVLRPGGGSGDGVPLQLGNGAAYARFYGLVFERATGSSTTNIYARGNAHDVEISGCVSRNSQRQGFFSEKSVARIHIIGCTFNGNGGGGPSQLDHNIYIQGSYNAVLGNLLAGAVNGNGIQVYPSSDHVLIAGNTITGSFREGIILGSEGGTTTADSLIVNNIITGNRSAVAGFWGGSTGGGNVVRNNLVWGNQSSVLSASGITFQSNTTADPRYVSAVTGDFHLAADSPALGAADPAFVLPADIEGDPRPLGSGPDLGAFEG